MVDRSVSFLSSYRLVSNVDYMLLVGGVLGPSCRYLLRAIEPLRFFLIEHHMYHFHQPAQRLTHAS